MRKQTWILVTAVLSIAFLGCPPKSETPSGSTGTQGGNDILVGEYGSLTGPQATFGTSTHNAIIMAAEEINRAGGIKGKKMTVITEDDESRSDQAVTVVTKLISQNNVLAVLGEVASSCSIAAGPICQSNKVPMISPSSTNPAVTQIGDYIFRTCFTDNYQGKYIAEFGSKFCEETGKPKTAAILTDIKNDYSQGLTTIIEQVFTQMGGRIVGKQSYSNGDSDFRSQLTTIKGLNPSIIFVPGYYTDVGQMARQRVDLGMTTPLVGGDGWESPKLIEIGGKALDGCYYTTHYVADDPTPVVRNFVTKYKDRFGAKPDAMAALGYDATYVLADALKRTKKLDGPSLRDAIAATKGYVGVTGTITLGPDRNPVGKKIVVDEVLNNQLILKATADPNVNGGAMQMVKKP
jgi:branched-chain amino acid transport system substrate-binding protein